MTVYIALLRSVNLAGNSVLKMADLKAIGEEIGLQRVRTYIASGNLLFTSDKSEGELKRRLEERVAAHMGRQVPVLIRTAQEMALVARSNPFTDAAGNNSVAFFMDEVPPSNLFETIRNCDDERIAAGVREIYVAYGEKGIGKSRLRIPAAEAGTARNMNTVAKLAELAREMA
jgi:uncharacterized protein (DUF1697 family)